MQPSLFLEEIDRKGLKIIGRAPYGFHVSAPGGSYRKGSGFPAGSSPRKPVGSSDGRWALGDRIYHDDHGYGSIEEIRESEDGPVIKVVFETGFELRFLSLHQSSRFTRIGED